MDRIELSEQDRNFIRRQMESGSYESASEVIHAGLRMLENQENLSEDWLREEISARMDELEKHPERAIPAEEVFANLEARHRDRLARKGGQ